MQPGDSGADTSRSGVALVTNILLFLMLQTYGSWVLTAVTREKASRVIEVLLAVIRPKQLLVGKTIGIGLVALGHAAVLIVVAYVTTRIVGLDITGGLRAGDLLVGAVWFLLGYALYCSVFAAAGALCARVEDAQAYAFPVMIPLLFAYIASFSAASGANTLLWVLAFFPPTAVLAMPTLYAIEAAPLWAVLLSMAITAAAVVVVANLAAKIYERSVLRTSRRVGWREAFRARQEIEPATTGSGLRLTAAHPCPKTQPRRGLIRDESVEFSDRRAARIDVAPARARRARAGCSRHPPSRWTPTSSTPPRTPRCSSTSSYPGSSRPPTSSRR